MRWRNSSTLRRKKPNKCGTSRIALVFRVSKFSHKLLINYLKTSSDRSVRIPRRYRIRCVTDIRGIGKKVKPYIYINGFRKVNSVIFK